ncbi:MAG: hypothetical protein JNK60_04290 [Acidobacteria bacterium]|nr:hypothetical protein [Acidobacteriota bacterium]
MNRSLVLGVRIALLLSLLVGIGTAALIAVRQPLWGNDYVAIWGLKGKALFLTGSLEGSLRPQASWNHPEYPVAWPALLSMTASLTGGWDDLRVAVLAPLLLALSATCAARAVRGSPEARLLAAALVALLPFYRVPIYAGYAEGLLATLLLAALALWREDRPAGAGRIAFGVILLALAAFTKKEGVLLLLAFLAASLLGRRWRLAAVPAAALLLGVVPWRIWLALHVGARPDADHAAGAFALAKLGTALRVLVEGEIGPNALLVAIGAALVALAPETRRRRGTLLSTLGLYVLALLATFGFTVLDVAWHARFTWDRLLFPVVAILVVVLAEAVDECVAQPLALTSPIGQATPVPPMPQ